MNYNFGENEIRVLKLPEQYILFNTKDILNVLEIKECPEGTDLAESSLDMASAVRLASNSNLELAEWLNETFAGYKLETLVRPKSDVEWNFE